MLTSGAAVILTVAADCLGNKIVERVGPLIRRHHPENCQQGNANGLNEGHHTASAMGNPD